MSLERSLNVAKSLSIPDFQDPHTKAFIQSRVSGFRDIASGHGNNFAYATTGFYNVTIDCRAYFLLFNSIFCLIFSYGFDRMDLIKIYLYLFKNNHIYLGLHAHKTGMNMDIQILNSYLIFCIEELLPLLSIEGLSRPHFQSRNTSIYEFELTTTGGDYVKFWLSCYRNDGVFRLFRATCEISAKRVISKSLSYIIHTLHYILYIY